MRMVILGAPGAGKDPGEIISTKYGAVHLSMGICSGRKSLGRWISRSIRDPQQDDMVRQDRQYDC